MCSACHLHINCAQYGKFTGMVRACNVAIPGASTASHKVSLIEVRASNCLMLVQLRIDPSLKWRQQINLNELKLK